MRKYEFPDEKEIAQSAHAILMPDGSLKIQDALGAWDAEEWIKTHSRTGLKTIPKTDVMTALRRLIEEADKLVDKTDSADHFPHDTIPLKTALAIARKIAE